MLKQNTIIGGIENISYLCDAMRRILAFVIFLAITCVLMAQGRLVVSLDFGWEFSRDSLFANAEHIDLPHDFQIGQPWVSPAADEQADNSNAAANTRSRLSARGFKEMGTGWYRKKLTLLSASAESPCEHRRTVLEFDGLLLVGDVWLNGRYVGGTDYGYVGFEVDVTDALHKGDNELLVKASTGTELNSRWYTGGGLIRGVRLVTTPRELYLVRHPLYITTRENRYVNIAVELCNRTKQRTALVRAAIYDPDGKLIAEQTDTARRITPSRHVTVRMKEVDVPDVKVWDTDTPCLYNAVVTLLYADGTVADRVEEQFGIRTVEIEPDYGLRLNGRKVLLKGIANHHDLGALGAAAYPRAIGERLRLLKRFGVNHVRTSHNPYSREFIQLCDRLGILVVDELYDKWTQQHTGGRMPLMNHWASDVTEWVRRDRNSPSVVLWSLGNELQQEANQPFDDFGVTLYKLMRTVVQRYDSTRLTTVAMHPRYRHWQTDSLPCDLAMQTDVQSYNYRYMYFPGDGRRFPWMTFYQSEASTSNMGPNYFGMDLDRVIGLAYWGAIDYLGESQGWPAKGWAQGVFDIALNPKPKAYLMKSLFTDEPVVHLGIVEDGNSDIVWNGVQTGNASLSENWNRQEGDTVSLYTYTNCDEVELLLNGRSLGRQPNGTSPQQRNQLRWDGIAFRRGTLEAVGYCAGKAVARHRIETTGKAIRLQVTPASEWHADGYDLQHVRVTAVDGKGRRVWSADDELTFSVSGDARIVAVTNGDIASDEVNTTDHRRLWQGTCMVVLRAGRQPSKVTLTVGSRRLGNKHYTLYIKD